MADDRSLEVHASEALTALRQAVERFSASSRKVGADIVLLVVSANRESRRIVEDAELNLEEARQTLDSASDDDIEWAREVTQAAAERLRLALDAAERLDEALTNLRQCEQVSSQAALRLGSACVAELDRKSQQLREYHSIGLPDDARSAAATSSAMPAAAPQRPPTLEELEQFTLPWGWKWIALSEIDSRTPDGEPIEFKKVSQADMRDGFERLRRDVLPALDRNLSAAGDRLRARDRAAGIHDTSGAHGAFEAFFTKDASIYLERAGAAGAFRITNGRHRIQIARELGWPAIPARAREAP